MNFWDNPWKISIIIFCPSRQTFVSIMIRSLLTRISLPMYTTRSTIHSSVTRMKIDRRELVLEGQRGLNQRDGVDGTLVDAAVEGWVIFIVGIDLYQWNRFLSMESICIIGIDLYQWNGFWLYSPDRFGCRMNRLLMNYSMVFHSTKSQYFTLKCRKITCWCS